MKPNLDKIDPELIRAIKEAVGEGMFEEWMLKSIPSLDGKTPWEVLNSYGGREKIEGLITAINYGLPSD